MYNRSEIFRKAWSLYRKGGITFAVALHRSWLSAKARPENDARIAQAQQLAGVAEKCLTWAGWKAEGRTVRHGERCLFQVVLVHASRGDGAEYRASFFSESQTEPDADAMTA